MKYILNNQTKSLSTEIIIGGDALESLGGLAAGYSKTVLITDEGTAAACMEIFQPYLKQEVETVVLAAGEDNKNIELVKDLLIRMRQAGLDRKSLIIGLGGGVINDIAGFAASIYMRGVDWVMVPTTLTAQADAAIGGKTGVNLGDYKNMAGSFWPTKAVLIDPAFLKTLPENHLKNGLAEIIKMGFICDKQILEHVSKIKPENIAGEELAKASELAAKAKIEIVGRDTFESGERKLLNFGHTVGHAMEGLSLKTGRPLLHGEAVAIGMVAEAKLAELESLCGPGLADEIKGVLERFGLPVSAGNMALADILQYITADKKNEGGKIYWTLPKTAGQGVFNHVAGQENIESAVKAVLGPV